jgi:hypothetical protein
VSATAWENTWSHSRRKRREEARRKEQAAKCAKLESGESTLIVGAQQTKESGENSESSILENTCTNSDLDKHGIACAEKMDTNSYVKEQIEGADSMDISEHIDRDSEGENQLDLDRNLSGKEKSESRTLSRGSRTGFESDVLPKEDVTQKTSCVQEETNDGEIEATAMTFAANSASGNVEKQEDRLPLFKCWISIRKEKAGIILEMKWMRGSSKEAMHQMCQYFKNHLI